MRKDVKINRKGEYCIDIYGIKLKKATPEIKEKIEGVFGYGPFGKSNTITIDEDYRFGIVDFAAGVARDIADVAGSSSFTFRGKILSEVVYEYQVFEGIYEDNILTFKSTGWIPIYEDDFEECEDESEDTDEIERVKMFLHHPNVFSKNNNSYFSEIIWDSKWYYSPVDKKIKRKK